MNTVELEERIEDAIGHPLLFEIGRDGLVELAAAQVAVPAAAAGVRTAATPASAVAQSVAATRQAETRVTYAILAGIVFLMLGVVMVVGKPGPAMLAAQRWWSSTGPVAPALVPAALVSAAPAAGTETSACSHRSTITVAMLQAAALGFAAGVVIELGCAGQRRSLRRAAVCGGDGGLLLGFPLSRHALGARIPRRRCGWRRRGAARPALGAFHAAGRPSSSRRCSCWRWSAGRCSPATTICTSLSPP